MIVHTGFGFAVVSEAGKFLTRKNMTRAEAEKRLEQIEYYKAKAKEAIRNTGKKEK